MAQTSGIGWTDGTVNFWLGCTHAGPGCDGCYAEVFAKRKFDVTFGPGQPRRKTKAGYTSPLRWNAWHKQGRTHMKVKGIMEKIPKWIFACSLADFFDNEVDPAWRAEAWAIIKATPYLRWQLVTKRIGNVPKMLPDDWDGGREYQHVGIIATMVNQKEYDRDAPKLFEMYRLGVKWTGISMEPQLGQIVINLPTDWVITGGESKQGSHAARQYHLAWAYSLIDQCAQAGIPIFVKQVGDAPVFSGQQFRKCRDSGTRMEDWPASLRVQQMPRIYGNDNAQPAADLLSEAS